MVKVSVCRAIVALTTQVLVCILQFWAIFCIMMHQHVRETHEILQNVGVRLLYISVVHANLMV